MSERLRYVVVGKVQGVAFRAYTKSTADELGVHGFVQNRPDGTVAGEVEGDSASVQRFVEWLREGSPWAAVADVAVTPIAATGQGDGFVITR
ncbi:MAG: acylphosphatase [bacterium]|nr:acylphosphatase [bacterium]